MYYQIGKREGEGQKSNLKTNLMSMLCKKNDILIAILEYGLKKFEGSYDFSKSELETDLEKFYDKEFIEYALPDILMENFISLGNDDYRISSTGYARLLSYRSFVKSKQSFRIAIYAILLSVISLGTTVYISFYKTSSIDFTEEQSQFINIVLNDIESSIKQSTHYDSLTYELQKSLTTPPKVDSSKDKSSKSQGSQ